MASLRDIRKRLKTVRNSQKMTKAMQLVAASKLRRAQEKILGARPYGQALQQLCQQALQAAELRRLAPQPLQQAAARQGDWYHGLLIVSSDRGLCGPFNAALLRFVEQWLAGQQRQGLPVQLACVGRKGRDYLVRRKYDVAWFRPWAGGDAALAKVLASYSKELLTSGQVQQLHVAFNRFKSAMTQEPSVVQVLPMQAGPVSASTSSTQLLPSEPDLPQLLAGLLPHSLQHQLLEILLESEAAEHGARMTAMDAATKNAKELTETLSLQYNRARQASITRDLMDIVGGAEALATA